MKLTLDFNGKTLLKDWWGQVKTLFQETEDALNAEEISRISGDSELQNNIDAEAAERISMDNVLQSNINEEISAREADFNRAYNKAEKGADAAEKANTGLNAEIQSRMSADSALNIRMTAVEGKAHEHGNKSAIDTITAEDIEQWNGIKSQVAQKQLDAAIAYFEEIGFSLSAQVAMLMNALGVVVYDGGWFGEKQDGVSFDGGAFEDENLALFDCGEFETAAAVLATLDGGNY